MNKFGIGQPVLRDEDVRFISGKGLYTADISLENQTYMYVLRSNVSNGIIKNIKYIKGSFFNASFDKSSKKNERNIIILENELKKKLFLFKLQD